MWVLAEHPHLFERLRYVRHALNRMPADPQRAVRLVLDCNALSEETITAAEKPEFEKWVESAPNSAQAQAAGETWLRQQVGGDLCPAGSVCIRSATDGALDSR